MNRCRTFAVLGVVLVLAVALHAADDGAAPAADKQDAREATGEATEAKAGAMKEVRLTQPWRKLTSLSEEQRKSIAEIHKKAVAEIKEIENRERESILALLSDEQKTELKTVMETEAAERKVRAGERKKAAEGATEEPAPAGT